MDATLSGANPPGFRNQTEIEKLKA